MNEQIEKLALRAGEYVNSVYIPPVRSKTPDKIWEDGHVDWHTQFNQKFAELIVEECMTMCDTVSADYLKHRKGAFDFQDKNIYAEGEAACDILKFKMKTYFGVEL
jgi:hypothetical protein